MKWRLRDALRVIPQGSYFPPHVPCPSSNILQSWDISGGTLVVLLSYCTLCDKGKGKKKGNAITTTFVAPALGIMGPSIIILTTFSGPGSTDGMELDKTRFIEYVTICTTIRGLEENTRCFPSASFFFFLGVI